MSKLAHSNEETMRQIEEGRLIREEGWKRCTRCGEVLEGADSAEGCRDLFCPAPILWS